MIFPCENAGFFTPVASIHQVHILLQKYSFFQGNKKIVLMYEILIVSLSLFYMNASKIGI